MVFSGTAEGGGRLRLPLSVNSPTKKTGEKLYHKFHKLCHRLKKVYLLFKLKSGFSYKSWINLLKIVTAIKR